MVKYYCDNARHLVCIPYSIENLHKMAEDLGIKRCWFHKNHYDIPKRRIKEIQAKCEVVSSKHIVLIIKGCVPYDNRIFHYTEEWEKYKARRIEDISRNNDLRDRLVKFYIENKLTDIDITWEEYKNARNSDNSTE